MNQSRIHIKICNFIRVIWFKKLCKKATFPHDLKDGNLFIISYVPYYVSSIDPEFKVYVF